MSLREGSKVVWRRRLSWGRVGGDPWRGLRQRGRRERRGWRRRSERRRRRWSWFGDEENRGSKG